MMSLSGKRVLVVEDEMLVAMHLEDDLTAMGLEVVGPAMRLDAALALAESADVDVAVLDVNIHGGRSYPVATTLQERGVPFIFATGYGHTEEHEAFAGVTTLTKPYRTDDLATALETACGRA
jgi:CheY-like chemotaxis protein